MKVTVNNGVGVFLAALKGKLPELLESGVFRCAQIAAGEIRRVVYSTFNGRTGALARSFKETFLGDANGGVRSAGALSDSVYAPIQDEGGTIRPSSRENLAIPLPGAGVPYGKWPRDYARGELHFIKSRRGNSLLCNRAGKPLFVLKPEVHVRGRGYLKTAADAAAPKMADIMGESIKVSVGRSIP